MKGICIAPNNLSSVKEYSSTQTKLTRVFVFCQIESSGVSLCSFGTVVCAPVGMASASISLVFLISDETLKRFSETMKTKRNKHRKIILLARSKLNGRGKVIFKGLMNAVISHKEFTLISKEAENYHWLKKDFKRKWSQKGDTERDRLVGHGKRI